MIPTNAFTLQRKSMQHTLQPYFSNAPGIYALRLTSDTNDQHCHWAYFGISDRDVNSRSLNSAKSRLSSACGDLSGFFWRIDGLSKGHIEWLENMLIINAHLSGRFGVIDNNRLSGRLIPRPFCEKHDPGDMTKRLSLDLLGPDNFVVLLFNSIIHSARANGFPFIPPSTVMEGQHLRYGIAGSKGLATGYFLHYQSSAPDKHEVTPFVLEPGTVIPSRLHRSVLKRHPISAQLIEEIIERKLSVPCDRNFIRLTHPIIIKSSFLAALLVMNRQVNVWDRLIPLPLGYGTRSIDEPAALKMPDEPAQPTLPLGWLPRNQAIKF